MVQLRDPVLASFCKDKDIVTWEELITRVSSMMKSKYTVSNNMKEIEAKGKIQPISMRVENRSGNKKVTLVDNIEMYGLNIANFCKECQQGVAASATVITEPNKPYSKLMVQGNQIIYIYNLLTGKKKLYFLYSILVLFFSTN